MLMIKMLIVISCSSLAFALLYTFFKIGRLSALDKILEHFEDAVKTIDKQNVIIQIYEQKLEEMGKEVTND